MSQSELKRLIDDMRRDDALASRIVGDDGLEAAVARAGEAGYEVTVDECRALAAPSKTELSDTDLEQVAGGKSGMPPRGGAWGGVVLGD